MSSIQLPTPASTLAVPSRSTTKRRKVRKGTFSCWECKSRKTRCEFKSASSTVCVSCQRRELSCISQEYADTSDGCYEEVGKRIDHVEALFSKLVGQRSTRNDQGQLSQKPQRAHNTVDAPAGNKMRTATPSLQAAGQEMLTSSCSLSGYLHSLLPRPDIAFRILRHGKFFNLASQMLQQRSKMPTPSSTEAQQLVQISKLPPPTTHPVFFARKLIQFALCLQQLDIPTSEQPGELLLDEPIRGAARRYLDLASRHVTSRDSLMESLDGLETLTLEASYHVNVANVRGAWLTIRRALGIAQLMDLPRLAEKGDQRMEFMWFRLIYSDRFLSLTLGLPSAVPDDSFASEHLLAVNTPSERLQRIHVVMVGRIIARNVRMQSRYQAKPRGDVAYDDYKETQDIDYELKQATRCLPATWWVLPTLHNVPTHAEVMEKTARICAQMHQFYLLVLLHHPYLIQRLCLQSASNGVSPSHHSVDFSYSTFAALSASREVLSRFLMVRNFHNTPSYRGLDDKGFTAALTLLLAHLDGNRLGYANVLEHQRPHDLGIIHNVIDTLHKDVFNFSSVEILRKLVEIEADAADGANYATWTEEGGVRKDHCINAEEVQSLSLSIPYFGTLHLVRQELHRSQLAISGCIPVETPLEAFATIEDLNFPTTDGNSLANIGSSVYEGITTSDLQLQCMGAPTAALNVDNNLTLLSSYSTRSGVDSPPSGSTPHIVPLLEDTMDAQDYQYPDVDEAWFETWMEGDFVTDDAPTNTEILSL